MIASVDPIFRFRNQIGTTFAVWLEPWAEEYEVANGSEIVVAMRGEPNDAPEIDTFSDRATIYAPLGCLIEITVDGITQNADRASSRVAFPASSTLGTRELTEMLFGEHPEARPGGVPFPQRGLRKWLSKFRRS